MKTNIVIYVSPPIPYVAKYNYTTRCLLDYPYFKENCILFALDLNKAGIRC